MLIYKKDDIQFVTGFLCLLGHPVYSIAPLGLCESVIEVKRNIIISFVLQSLKEYLTPEYGYFSKISKVSF